MSSQAKGDNHYVDLKIHVVIVTLGVRTCLLHRIIFLARLFLENARSIAIAVASSFSVVGVVVQKLKFCNNSVTAENIYLQVGVYVHYPKSNRYY